MMMSWRISRSRSLLHVYQYTTATETADTSAPCIQLCVVLPIVFFNNSFFSPGTPKMNWGLLISKLIAGTATLFLFWLIVQCPCKRLLCCHLPNVWVTLAVFVGTIVFVNGFQWSDASCLVRG